MGKSGYKKFKKQEKAKVKLKGNKTLLPKGQNITDTNFKVKKIVVKEQLKSHSEHELITRKHLNLKDLLSRLSHHNVSMRLEAVSGLKELIVVNGPSVVQANLSPLLQASMTLTVDKESDVRKETLKLLSVIFQNVSRAYGQPVTEEEFSPLFSLVISHLKCGMTHIEPSIRSDSLRLLDVMLATLPRITAAHTATLLPYFLDLISHQGSAPGEARTLSLNLDGKVTSEKWRTKVIGRLNRLFSVVASHVKKDVGPCNRSVKWSADKHIYLGLYSSLKTAEDDSKNTNNLPVQDYSKLLMPLLLDTFTEAVPKQNLEDTETSCVVTLDVIALLQSIVEVVLHIWNLSKNTTRAESKTDWFRNTWGETVASRMFKHHFPYSVAACNSRKRKRESEQVLAALQVSEPSCSLLNLQICLLIFLLTKPGDMWEMCIKYIKRCLRNGGSLKPEENATLCECLEAASSQPLASEATSLLQVISKSDILISIDKPCNRRAFDYLTQIALLPSHHLHMDKQFTGWLDSLPALLCRPVVSLATICSIANIAARNLPAFSTSLDGWIEEILDKLPSLKVTGDSDNEGHKLIINLIYWVRDWDEELMQGIQLMVQQVTLGPVLSSYLLDILRLKFENTEDENIKTMLMKILELSSNPIVNIS